MALFTPSSHQKYIHDEKIYALYQLAYTGVDVTAALLFIVGSILFFQPSQQIAGTWCFLFGSLFFAAKPTLRILREVYFLYHGKYEDVIADATGTKPDDRSSD